MLHNPIRAAARLGIRRVIAIAVAAAAAGLAQTTLALARIMDNRKAVNQQPAAAKALATLLDTLRVASPRGRRGGVAAAKAMVELGGA